MTPLTTSNHDRDSAGLTYVYPVVSRRAGGVSVGINLNPNNACNWACVYCQVPGLTRGSAPAIDLAQLEAELSGFLGQARTPAWLAANAPEGARKLTDIAFSGNGEPTTADGFDGIVGRVLGVRAELGLDLKTVLITNGSQMHRPGVIGGLRAMADARGEVWFKIDAGTAAGRGKVNGTPIPSDRVAQNLGAAAAACSTKVQTCLFAVNGVPPADAELDAYLDLLRAAEEGGAGLAGVLLYGLARPSMQPDAERLSALPPGWLDDFAGRVTAATGLSVSVHG